MRTGYTFHAGKAHGFGWKPSEALLDALGTNLSQFIINKGGNEPIFVLEDGDLKVILDGLEIGYYTIELV